MTTIAARYDASALAYRTWWEPVLAPAALGLLDRLEQLDGPPTGGAIDVGTGAGLLAIEAVRRWPTIRVLGLDGSAEMLAVARQTAEANLPAGARARLAWLRGHAERLPGADASVDLVISSFAYQLVPRLTAALTDAFRVLRPGGRLAFVTWRIADDRFAPDEAFEDALDELEPPDEATDDAGAGEEARAGDLASARATASRLRRIGFRSVVAREAWLTFDHDPATYLDFLEGYAERELFAELVPDERTRLRRLTAARLAQLPRSAFRWRVPVVHALARRPESIEREP